VYFSLCRCDRETVVPVITVVIQVLVMLRDGSAMSLTGEYKNQIFMTGLGTDFAGK